MLLLYALAHPLPSLLTSANNESLPSPEASLAALNSCFDIQSHRTVEEILYSCLAVVFACTWIAIHPNIPRFFDKEGAEIADSFTISSARVITQDVATMLLSLLAPELIVLWALRQWFAAREIAKKYSQYGWTKTHGHFLIMGGFALFEDGRYRCTLEDSNESNKEHQVIKENIQCQIEIRNSQRKRTEQPSQQSKPEEHYSPYGDPPDSEDSTQGTDASRFESTSLSKEDAPEIYLLEFLIQHKYIEITENEITAKAKTDFLKKFIAVGQTTWFIVQCIARVKEGLVVTNLEVVTFAFALVNIGTYVLWWNKPQRVRYPVKVDYCRRHAKKEITVKKDRSAGKSFTSWIKRRVEAMLLLTPKFRDWALHRSTKSAWKSFTSRIERIRDAGLVGVILSIPLTFSIYHLCGGQGSYQTGLMSNPLSLYPTLISLFLVIGGIHCVPWNSTFSTYTEQLLWRVSAVTVTAFPLVWFSLVGVLTYDTSRTAIELIRAVIRFIAIIFLPLMYICARITLIIIAFTELRALPPSAHQTVDWARFIPHI
ncbi:hypothetical protein K435DRAFT_757137 [Dendrothele bispora CBS 962.96]|uniref:Uncharacterized protein n=1 Tax=Dendrothele bispora (strain CBS 962.96) TaxID=1314807 RepID=A0A4S8LW15_DENBC|nr:hypothetical protein K435DRAFT_757137 [Dendrothele bispora CBS 962.96]